MNITHLDQDLHIKFNEDLHCLVLQKFHHVGKVFEELNSEIIGITPHDCRLLLDAIFHYFPELQSVEP